MSSFALLMTQSWLELMAPSFDPSDCVKGVDNENQIILDSYKPFETPITASCQDFNIQYMTLDQAICFAYFAKSDTEGHSSGSITLSSCEIS